MSNTPHQRERLSVEPAAVIKALPGMGRLMINTRQGGATHERMGVVEAVAEDNGWLVCSGAEHDSRIEVGAITAMIVDRTSIMGGQCYPRIDFMQDADTVLCSVIGFAGIEPFDAVVSQFGPGEALEIIERTPPGGNAATETDPNDPGTVPFQAALASAQGVTVRITRPGFTQDWAGVVEKVSPSRGFINVMRTDFHLHLRAGAVASWRQDTDGNGAVMVALNADGEPTGLTVHGPAAAFVAPAPIAEAV